jgi:hypothetical protein
MGGSIEIVIPRRKWPTFGALNSAIRAKGFPVELTGYSDANRLVEYVPLLGADEGNTEALTSARVAYLNEYFEDAFHFFQVTKDDIDAFFDAFGEFNSDGKKRLEISIGDYWVTTSDPDIWKQDNAGLYVASTLVSDFGGFLVGDVPGEHQADLANLILQRLYLDELKNSRDKPTVEGVRELESGLISRFLNWFRK